MDDFVKVIDQKDKDALVRELIKGDTLTDREGQMILNMPGVSINSSPRADGRYQGYVLHEGKRRYFYADTQKHVSEKIIQFIREGGGERKKKNATQETLASYAEKWMNLYKVPNLKASTIESIRHSLKPALEQFGDRTMRSIKSDELQGFLLGMKAERMRDLCKTYLSQIFKKAHAQDIIRKNPFDTIEIKAHKQKHRLALTSEQQGKFLQYVRGNKYEQVLVFMLQTGARVGEALALEKSDLRNGSVSISKNVVFVQGKRIVQDSPKTAAGCRTIPLSFTLECKLRDLPGDVLFPFTYNAIRLALSRISDALGFDVTAHTLRHTFATRLEEQGIPPKVRQYLLGHSSVKMTLDTYTDALPEYVDRYNSQLRDIYKDS